MSNGRRKKQEERTPRPKKVVTNDQPKATKRSYSRAMNEEAQLVEQTKRMEEELKALDQQLQEIDAGLTTPESTSVARDKKPRVSKPPKHYDNDQYHYSNPAVKSRGPVRSSIYEVEDDIGTVRLHSPKRMKRTVTPVLPAPAWTTIIQPQKPKPLLVPVQRSTPTISLLTCLKLVKQIEAMKSSWPFREPVDVVGLGLHDYLDMIRRPMDLKTVSTKLQRNEYHSSSQVVADIRQIWANAFLYNPPENVVYKLALELEQFFEKKLTECALQFDPAHQKKQLTETVYNLEQQKRRLEEQYNQLSADVARQFPADQSPDLPPVVEEGESPPMVAVSAGEDARKLNYEEVARLREHMDRLEDCYQQGLYRIVQNQPVKLNEKLGDVFEMDMTTAPVALLNRIGAYIELCNQLRPPPAIETQTQQETPMEEDIDVMGSPIDSTESPFIETETVSHNPVAKKLTLKLRSRASPSDLFMDSQGGEEEDDITISGSSNDISLSQTVEIPMTTPLIIIPTEKLELDKGKLETLNLASWSSLDTIDEPEPKKPEKKPADRSPQKKQTTWGDFRNRKALMVQREKEVAQAAAEKLLLQQQKEEQERKRQHEEAERLRQEAEEQLKREQEREEQEKQQRMAETERLKEAERARRAGQAPAVNMLSQKEMMDGFEFLGAAAGFGF